MLLRAVARSLQTPVVRAAPATLRIASSTVWSRSMARHNRPNHGQKRPTDYSRPHVVPPSSQPGSAGTAFSSPQQGRPTSEQSEQPDFSKSQNEVSERTSPERNTALRPEPTQAATPQPAARKVEDPEFSQNQDELETPASPSENTAPEHSPPSAIDPAEAQAQGPPLPDLTRGIPSTLEYETT